MTQQIHYFLLLNSPHIAEGQLTSYNSNGQMSFSLHFVDLPLTR